MFIIQVLLLVVCTSHGQSVQDNTGNTVTPPARPNILVIMTDQQSAAMLSCAGNKWLKTPSLDKLASEGVRFEKAYATNPVCLPSRFSIQSGLFSSVLGIRENDRPLDKDRLPMLHNIQSRSLGNLFSHAGYDTYYGGKVHLPAEIQNAVPWGYTVLSKDERNDLAKTAADFLLTRKTSDNPFLLFVSFINPHDICYDAIRFGWPDSQLAKETPHDLLDALQIPRGISRKDFFDRYCPPLPANYQPMIGESYTVDSLVRLRSFRQAVREQWTEEQWRLHRWAYARLTERADSLIGQVLAALDQSGVKNNTIVVFTSDHGDNDASHKLEHKTVFYEESARVPLIISYPWMKEKGKVDSQHTVSNGLDLLPTLCDIAGVQSPSTLPGQSLAPLFSSSSASNWRKHLFIESELGYLIHTGRYKYELDDKNGNQQREVFTDLQVDPGETVNMINRPGYAAIIKQLRKELTDHLSALKIKFTPPGK